MNPFFIDNDTPWKEICGGVKRKIVAYTEELMLVVHFKEGAIGAPHAHDIHGQIGYVAEGSFEAEMNGEKKI